MIHVHVLPPSGHTKTSSNGDHERVKSLLQSGANFNLQNQVSAVSTCIVCLFNIQTYKQYMSYLTMKSLF